MRHLLWSALLFAGLATPVLAVAISKQNHGALINRIAEFQAAFRANDMAAVFGVVPPEILAAIAAQFGISVDMVIDATQQQVDAYMSSVSFESFSMPVADLAFEALPDGMLYTFIPTETVIDFGGAEGRLRTSTTTVALLDDDVWYLVRIENEQQIGILRQAYPGFANVTFPESRTETLSE